MKDLFQDLTPTQRVEMLESNAFDLIENHTYRRPLTDEELAEEREAFTNAHIEIERMQNELAEIMAQKKQEIKLKQKVAAAHLDNIKHQSEEKVDTVFLIQDFKERKIGTYNSEGILLTERPMRGKERQSMIPFQLGKTFDGDNSRTGTDDE